MRLLIINPHPQSSITFITLSLHFSQYFPNNIIANENKIYYKVKDNTKSILYRIKSAAVT